MIKTSKQMREYLDFFILDHAFRIYPDFFSVHDIEILAKACFDNAHIRLTYGRPYILYKKKAFLEKAGFTQKSYRISSTGILRFRELYNQFTHQRLYQSEIYVGINRSENNK